jgi:uncharacterized protein YbjT (DUF2867 family)
MDRLGHRSLTQPMTNTSPHPPNNTAELIVVLGGTGKTGRRVARRLREKGRAVRIGSRSGDPRFEWSEPSTWAPVLRGAGSVYVAYSPDAGFPGATEAIGSLTSLAVQSGAHRVVLLTGRGEAGARRSEEAVQASGAEWTIVRSSFFAQNFSEDFLADAVSSGVVAFPAGGVAEPFIDVEDIADVAVAALTEDDHAGRVYEVTGPRLLTFADAIGEIAEATGREIRYVPVTAEEFAAGMIAQGAPPGFAAALTELLETVLDGRNSSLTDGVRAAIGRAPIDFAAYARAAAEYHAWDRPEHP